MLRNIFQDRNSKDQLAQLHALFPQFDDSLLLVVLQERKHKLEDAVEALMEMISTEKAKPPAGYKAPVVYAPHPRDPRASARLNVNGSKRRKYNRNKRKQAAAFAPKQPVTPLAAQHDVFVPSPNPFELLAARVDKDEKVRQVDASDDEVHSTIQFSQLVVVAPSSSTATTASPSASVDFEVLATPKAVDESIPVEAAASPSPVMEEKREEPTAAAAESVPEEEKVFTFNDASVAMDDSVFIMIPRDSSIVDVMRIGHEGDHEHHSEKHMPIDVSAVPSSPVEQTPVTEIESKPVVVLDVPASTSTVTITVPPSTLSTPSSTSSSTTAVSVKIQSAQGGMRRVGVHLDDPSAYEKIAQSAAHLLNGEGEAGEETVKPSSVYPKYKDEEGDLVAVHSMAELEECVRVHEQYLWPAAPQLPRIVRLYV